jgi:hypothetical protein
MRPAAVAAAWAIPVGNYPMQKSCLLTGLVAITLSAGAAAAQPPGFTDSSANTTSTAPLALHSSLRADRDTSAVYSAAAQYYIESVAFDATYDSRISDGPIPTPVLLISDGTSSIASYNPSIITTPIDIDYDRQEHPEDWPAWRRSNGVAQIQESNGWRQVHYPYEVGALPSGTRLSGTFEHRRDATVGTTAASSADYRFRFYADGTYESCTSTLVVVPAVPTIKREYTRFRGRYKVDGYTITITNDADSSTSSAPFFYDPERPTRLWIGSDHYPAPSDNLSDICRKL